MNIHEAAVAVLHTPNEGCLPNLHGNGLCFLFRGVGVGPSAYAEMGLFTDGELVALDHYGYWTEQRINIVILLAITTPEDFI